MKKLVSTVCFLSVSGCWGWPWPPGGGGSGGAGGTGGTSGTGGTGGAETCAPTDQFLLVTEEVSGDCGEIYEEVVTPSDEGWFNPAFDAPCVVDGCQITCDRSHDSATFDVTQELDLLLGDATFDNPMTITQVDTSDHPYECASDYLIDVTRVEESMALQLQAAGARSVGRVTFGVRAPQVRVRATRE
jgi:hypothetical protein